MQSGSDQNYSKNHRPSLRKEKKRKSKTKEVQIQPVQPEDDYLKLKQEIEKSHVRTNEQKMLKAANQLIGFYRREPKAGISQSEMIIKLERGESMEQTIKRSKILAPIIYWHFILNLYADLDALLKQGVLHRDIKLSNIMANFAALRFTLIDWGMAKMMDPGRTDYRSFSSAGTTKCQAPEIKPAISTNLPPLRSYNESTEAFAAACTVAYSLYLRRGEKGFRNGKPNPAGDTLFDQIEMSDEVAVNFINTLNSQASVEPDQRMTFADALKTLESIYCEKMGDIQRVYKLGFLDLSDYADMDLHAKIGILKELIKIEKVILVDKKGCHSHDYFKLKKEIESEGFCVSDVVVQYTDDKLDLPAAIVEHLKVEDHPLD